MISTIQFGEYELDAVRHELRRAGRVVKLQQRPCDLLLLLIEKQGSLVTREEIAQRLWGTDLHVDSELSINTAVRKVRYALKDDADQQRYIQTVVGKGYRFIATANYLSKADSSRDPNFAAPASTALSTSERAAPGREAVIGETAEGRAHASAPEAAAMLAKPIWSTVPPETLAANEAHARTGKLTFINLGIITMACLLTGSAIWYLRKDHNGGSPEFATVRSLAVLPFRNLSGDADQDFVADSLTDELTARLGQFRSIRVISAHSTMKLRNAKDQLTRIRRELNVDAVIEGSEWLAQGHLRVAIRLLDTRNGHLLWNKTYEILESDAAAIRSGVLGDATGHVSDTLRLGKDSDNAPSHTPNSLAYNEYLRGRYLWNKRTLEGLEKSIEYYQRALKADPQFAEAYAALADSYVLLSSYGGPEPARSLDLAAQNALRALQLNSRLGEAHAVLGAVKVDRDWNWAGAEEEYRMALRLSPEYPTAHHWYALHLSRLGRHAEAEVQIKEALELDPLSLIINTDAGEIFYRAADLNGAVQYLRKVLELDPNFADAHLVLGEVYERQHKLSAAIEEFRTAEKLFHAAPNVLSLEGHALALAGNRKSALEISDYLVKLSRQRYVSGVDIAMIYCALGDSDQAMTWLEKAYARRDKGLNILAADPLFSDCRGDPRFVDLLSKLRLPDLQLP